MLGLAGAVVAFAACSGGGSPSPTPTSIVTGPTHAAADDPVEYLDPRRCYPTAGAHGDEFGRRISPSADDSPCRNHRSNSRCRRHLGPGAHEPSGVVADVAHVPRGQQCI